MSGPLDNRILHSIAGRTAGGAVVRFEYSLTVEGASWYHHDLDEAGALQGIGRCRLDDVRAVLEPASVERFSTEMERVAEVLDRAWFDLTERAREEGCEEDLRRALVRCALQVRADRRDALESLVDVCTQNLQAGWSQPSGLERSREAAAAVLDYDYPEARHPLPALTPVVAWSWRHRQADGRQALFEFVWGSGVCSWYRHDLDEAGLPVAAGRCTPADIRRATAGPGQGRFAEEMLRAAQSLDEAQADLLARAEDERPESAAGFRLAQRAMHLRRAREEAIGEARAAWSPSYLAGAGPDAQRRG